MRLGLRSPWQVKTISPDLEKILLAALIAAVSAIFLQMRKDRLEGFAARVDEFCELIFVTADLAAEYWVSDKPQAKARDRSRAALRARLQLIETQIEGGQAKIDLFRVLVQAKLRAADREVLLTLMPEFFNALTGGQFGARARKPDPPRARLHNRCRCSSTSA
jgi:hypothetical protein